MPVWLVASAVSATQILNGQPFAQQQRIDLPDQSDSFLVQVYLAVLFADGDQAVAITHCESCLGLDLTRDLEIWTFVQFETNGVHKLDKKFFYQDWLSLVPGEGVGVFESTGKACVSGFTYQLLEKNLRPLVPRGKRLKLEVVLPAGRMLADRTSNKAFGVVEGLSLIGTQAISQNSASPEQLENALESLKVKCNQANFKGEMIFVIGENGLDLAENLGLGLHSVVKTGNWLGPLIVAAAEEGVTKLLLFGYHGKLIKLAGGIFHTHNHLADARLEILIALAVYEGIPLDLIKTLAQSESIEGALLNLETCNIDIAKMLWNRIASVIEEKSIDYISKYGAWKMQIGAALFDRQRSLRWAGPIGIQHLASYGVKAEPKK